MRRIAVPLIAAVVLAGCAGSPVADPATNPTDMALAEPACLSVAETERADFVGLDQAAAEELAAAEGLVVREVGRDGECFIVTEDHRDDRINLEYADGVVVGAAIY